MRLKTEPAVGVVAAPDIPEFLDDGGREEWRRIVPELIERRTLTRADMAVLAIYCHSWSAYVRLANTIDDVGLWIIEEKGKGGRDEDVLKPNPLIDKLAVFADRILKAADRFGMSPAAKARVKALDVGQKKEANPKSRFFREWEGNKGTGQEGTGYPERGHSGQRLEGGD